MPRPERRYDTRADEEKIGLCYPCCCICVGFIIVAVTTAVGMVVAAPELNLDFSSFMKTDVPTSMARDSFVAALEKRGNQQGRRLAGTVYHTWDVELIYEFQDDTVDPENSSNALSLGLYNEGIVSRMKNLEDGLRSLPGWSELCDEVDLMFQPYCRRGVSFANFMYPTRDVADGDIVPSSLDLNSGGFEAVPLDVALSLVASDHSQVPKLLFPANAQTSSLVSSPKMLRTYFRFNYACCTTDASSAEQRKLFAEQKKQWTQLISEQVVPYLREHRSIGSADVFFDGSGISTLDISQTLVGDLLLAIASMSFVLVYMVFHTRSFCLGFFGLVIITIAVPFAYVVAVILTGNRTMSLASGLSLFLVVGIGSDVIFVYADFWKHSKETSVSDWKRIKFVFRKAGKASLATTATTAASFFANLASILKSLRDFGFFMGMCVMLVWVLVSFIFLPICFVNERFWENVRGEPKEPEEEDLSGWRAAMREARRKGQESLAKMPELTTEKWIRVVNAGRVPCVLITLLLAIGLGVWAGMVGVTSTDLPSIFPEGHNQGQIARVLAEFEPSSQLIGVNAWAPSSTKTVCEEREPQSSCDLHWCEIMGDAQTDSVNCQCFRNELDQTCGSAARASVTQRFVAMGDPSGFETLDGPVGGFIINSSVGLEFQSSISRDGDLIRATELKPLITQDWYTGETHHFRWTEVVSEPSRVDENASCGWTDICYCGMKPCPEPSSWTEVDFAGLHLSNPLRRLATGNVPTEQQATVDVVFGMDLKMTGSFLGAVEADTLWSFRTSFNHRDPWTQRSMLNFCEAMPETLKVTRKVCWIENFKNRILSKGNRFPVLESDFDSEFEDFARRELISNTQVDNWVWHSDYQMQASLFTFKIDLHTRSSAYVAIDHKKFWDDYLAEYNSKALLAANGAIQTSSLWVQAEAVKELVASTVSTMAVAIAFAFIGMLIVTVDLLLSMFVVLSTLANVCFLAAFMVLVMNWNIGAIEIVALIAFIGYAMTYSLHIAHRYSSYGPSPVPGKKTPKDTQNWAPQIRNMRTHFAIQTIGQAALGSAITTVGCALPLLFCLLTIFVKLGLVVLVVTILSIIMALGPLPASLLWLGPRDPGTAIRRLCRRAPKAEPEETEPEAEAEAGELPPPARSGNGRA
mmetsp:Transcript_57841/g.102759  ORF Transcript_57841/g.102759 Transcript_57841/m.102759 type:complete len:1149 (+) Transcript_57841:67-3513(+)|eukprot:CAMPEP_0197630966 /NCGR_PEP_ID=MMETSP1338-20131121/8285_1 /TAXON_ID=43686 ORGANISM="Pelagodinium beii, Strain RCC1491" /NCGR_SAMPLE_ID=MMETSP1338 /ASSEMBLY_ACC=CAM_ASM_000754 /LENGTH=1148 /DNA_ID=CAMNT_0043202321 /DNA_START=58 /DNA_END=3504 /DNA_ORIENTATION=+